MNNILAYVTDSLNPFIQKTALSSLFRSITRPGLSFVSLSKLEPLSNSSNIFI